MGGASVCKPGLAWQWSWLFHHLTLTPCQYCLIFICLGRVWLTVELPKTKPTHPSPRPDAPPCNLLWPFQSIATHHTVCVSFNIAYLKNSETDLFQNLAIVLWWQSTTALDQRAMNFASNMSIVLIKCTTVWVSFHSLCFQSSIAPVWTNWQVI